MIDSIVCGCTPSAADDDQHDHVGHVGAAGTHAGEGLVAGRVDERDALGVVAFADVDHPRGGVLRDAARFAGGDVGVADLVQQAGLAVVDVAEDRDDRRPRTAGSPGRRSRSSNSCISSSSSVASLRDLQLDAVFQRDRPRRCRCRGWLIVREHALRISLLMMSLLLMPSAAESDLTVIGSSISIGSPFCTPVLAMAWVPRLRGPS